MTSQLFCFFCRLVFLAFDLFVVKKMSSSFCHFLRDSLAGVNNGMVESKNYYKDSKDNTD